jgi:hypothetical protein
MQRGIMLQFHPIQPPFQYPPSIHELICITSNRQIKLHFYRSHPDVFILITQKLRSVKTHQFVNM